MLLNYYDNYVNELFIPENFESGDGSTDVFHMWLNTYVYGSSDWGAIHIYDAASGINEYLLDQGLHYGIDTIQAWEDSQNAVLSQIVSTLKGGEPVIASMGTDYGASMNHSVLIYSVTYTTSVPTLDAVFTMNMGWRGIFNSKPCYHTRECVNCNFSITSMHADSWDTRLNRCLKCTRRGAYTTPGILAYTPVT